MRAHDRDLQQITDSIEGRYAYLSCTSIYQFISSEQQYFTSLFSSLPPSCNLYFLLFIFLPTQESSLYKKMYSIHVSSLKCLQHERRIKILGDVLVSSFCAWIQHLVLFLLNFIQFSWAHYSSLSRSLWIPSFCCVNTAQSHVSSTLAEGALDLSLSLMKALKNTGYTT